LINALVSLAGQENDEGTRAFLQWFVDEQEEEEESADAVVQKLTAAGDSSDPLMALDRELGERKS
jgi:ferritin